MSVMPAPLENGSARVLDRRGLIRAENLQGLDQLRSSTAAVVGAVPGSGSVIDSMEIRALCNTL
jgi:hypothetical protein